MRLFIDLLLLSTCMGMVIIGVDGLNHTHKCPERNRIMSLEQQMYSRTGVIKKLGMKHNMDINFIFERDGDENN